MLLVESEAFLPGLEEEAFAEFEEELLHFADYGILQFRLGAGHVGT